MLWGVNFEWLIKQILKLIALFCFFIESTKRDNDKNSWELRTNSVQWWVWQYKLNWLMASLLESLSRSWGKEHLEK